ncbi:MAG: NAD(P)H-hydrate dehydratase [Clostridia bacterium]|nr:NAD(P)H-hydrate dehydratase [Clostridia bacterium]
MRTLITPQAMREGEARYFASSGVPSIEVMERAATALAGVIAAELPAGATIYFACGTGGNGGDGTACARLLHENYNCVIVQPRPPKSPDAIANLRRAIDRGVAVAEDASDLPGPDAWVDALFGTGLTRAPGGAEAALIERINADHAHGARVYAADIPSGLNGETGQAYDPCIYADHTVTFQYLKTGMTLADGLDACGEITVSDVGFPTEGFDLSAALFEPADLGRILQRRPRNVHKGDCGHLLIVAGSFGMAGAAALCAKAALRSGAGLVTIACPRSIVPILQTLVPQAMCIPLAESEGAISAEALPALEAALGGKSAVAIGPGLSRRADPDILRAVLESGLPAVIDADGLNLLSEHRELMTLLTPRHVLTPHPGEAARLLGHPCTNPIADAAALCELGATVLFKGAASVIRSPEHPAACVSASGCRGMARGGSGDVLSGILGALLADRRGVESAHAAACASEIHGLAGELAQRKYGARSMNAADILEFLPEVFREYVE